MAQDWQWSRTDIEGYFTSVIERFDSSALLDKDGTLLAYMCMQYNGSMAMLYVRPQHRKDGYFNIILSDLTRKILSKSDIAYGFIPTHDISLINQVRELGFEWVPQGGMTWVKYTPPPGQVSAVNKEETMVSEATAEEYSESETKRASQPLHINAIPLMIR